MTPQELKNSILQLAIQGKLVEQRPEEGTAEELYRQIQQEKQALIKAGKIKKEKALPEITEDEIAFEIPESWKWVRLGMIIREVIVPMRDKPPFSSHGIPWCRIEDRDGILLNGSKSNQLVSDDTIQSMNLKVVPIGTVLSACTGGSIGTIVINTVECCTNQTFNGLVCSSGLYNWYLFWYLTSKFQDLRRVGTGTTIAYVSQNKSKVMLIPLPPLAEQKRIVAKIEELLPYIDRYEKAWNRLEDFNKRFPADMQKSILQLAIQGKLVEQRPEEGTGEALYQQIQKEKQALIKAGKIKKEKPLPEITEDEMEYDIPRSWKAVRLGDVISLLSGTDFKPEEYNDQKRGMPYITGASSLSEKGVLLNRWTETPRVIARKGDVLLVCKGSGYGKTVICDVEEAHIARQIMSIQYTNLLDMKYIMCFLNANLSLIKANGQGVIPGIDRGSVQKMVFPLPPLAEQKRIVAKLEELLPLCERLK